MPKAKKATEARLLQIIERYNSATKRAEDARKDMDFYREVAQQEFSIDIANNRMWN